MPKGPQGQKRLADTVQAAMMVARISDTTQTWLKQNVNIVTLEHPPAHRHLSAK
jgi:hypothetical protein